MSFFVLCIIELVAAQTTTDRDEGFSLFCLFGFTCSVYFFNVSIFLLCSGGSQQADRLLEFEELEFQY